MTPNELVELFREQLMRVCGQNTAFALIVVHDDGEASVGTNMREEELKDTMRSFLESKVN